MALWPEPPLSELLWSCAVARLILSPDISLQCPPNLTPEPDDAAPTQQEGAEGHTRKAAWQSLLSAGINDWGESTAHMARTVGRSSCATQTCSHHAKQTLSQHDAFSLCVCVCVCIALQVVCLL